MRYILIPVKELTQAKQRLAEVMTKEERTLMAWTMLETTFAAARASSCADRIAVVTLYQPAAELARSYGMEVIDETEQISESASVDFGSREVEQLGATAVLRLPIDLPLVRPQRSTRSSRTTDPAFDGDRPFARRHRDERDPATPGNSLRFAIRPA